MAECDCNHTHAAELCGCGAAHDQGPARRRARWWGAAGRFFGWWVGMSGLMGMFAVCPCCGQPACANGVIGMGFAGAVMASFLRVRNWFRRGGQEEGSSSSATLAAADTPEISARP